MKLIVLVLSAVFFSTNGFAQEDVSIKDVLQKETAAFFKHDFKTAYSYWHIKPQSLAIVSEPNGEVLYLTGKELNAEFTAKALSSAVFPDSFERSKWLMQMGTSTAYVTFQQSELKGNKITGQTYESRYMEKINGQWKIISMTVVNYKK